MKKTTEGLSLQEALIMFQKLKNPIIILAFCFIMGQLLSWGRLPYINAEVSSLAQFAIKLFMDGLIMGTILLIVLLAFLWR